MTEIYSVEGSIEDGMRGISFELGIYDSLDIARQEIKSFLDKYLIGEYMIEKNSDDSYDICTKNMIFCIYIRKIKLNKTEIPSLFIK